MMSDEAPLVTGYGASFYPQRHGYTGHTPRPPAAAPRDRGGPGRNAERATAEAAGTGAIPPDHAYTNRVKVGARAAGPPLWPAGGRGRPRGASPHSRVSREETDVDVCNLQQQLDGCAASCRWLCGFVPSNPHTRRAVAPIAERRAPAAARERLWPVPKRANRYQALLRVLCPQECLELRLGL